MSFLTCRSKIDVRHSKQPTKLSTFLRSLPSVQTGHVDLNWFLSWPHASTLYSAIANFEKVDHVYYKRHVLEHKDEGNNTLDFAIRTQVDLSEAEYEVSGQKSLPPRTSFMTSEEIQEIGSETEGLLIVLVHGLAGGSHENYIRRTVTAIFQECSDDSKVSVVAFNARGCARSKVTSKQYWNAMQTDDLSDALKFLSDKYPNRRILGVGYSLGANILCNYMARFGDAAKVSLGISVSNPWALNKSNVNLESYWLGRLYSRRMAGGLQRLFHRNAHLLAQHEGVTPEAVMSAKSLREFDDAFTAKAFGFASAEEYYLTASSARVVHAVKKDLIILNAKDDPMALDEVLPYDQVAGNEHLCLLATENGGHIGWYGPENGRWFVSVITQTIQGMLDHSI